MNPKTIVVVTPACHFSVQGAAQHDIYAAIELLQRHGYKVALYTIDSDKQGQTVLAQVGERYNIVVKKFRPNSSFIKRVRQVLRDPALFDGSASVFDELVHDPDFQTFIQTEKPACLWSFCSYSYPVFTYGKRHGIPTIFRSHNYESSFFWEELSPLKKTNPLNWLRYGAKHSAERRSVERATTVATLPFADVSRYEQWRKKGVVRLTLLFLPPLVSPPRIAKEKTTLDVFYLGASYNVAFHRRGAAVLIRKIAPALEKAAPGVFKIHICGGKLPKDLAAACVVNCVYEGYVPDLNAFLADMDAAAFPVFTGRTMKGKVFESLARAFPIVMASNCLGNYALVNGQEVLLAETVSQFVEKLLAVRDAKLRNALSTGASAFAERELSFTAIEKGLIEVLNHTIP